MEIRSVKSLFTLNSLRIFSLCILIFLFILSLVNIVRAEGHVYRGPIISPVNHVLTANKGDTVQGSVNFTNDLEQEGELPIKVKTFNFELNQDYSLNENVQVTPGSDLASWIKLDKTSFSAKKGQNIEVKYTINIPATADFGDKFADIVFETGSDLPNNSASPIYIKVRLQYPIVLNVGGRNDEKLIIKTFRTSQPMYMDEEISFITEIENAGNKFVLPVGRVNYWNEWFGPKKEMDFNSGAGVKAGYVFAGSNSIRQFVDKNITEFFDIGLHTGTISIRYGANNNVVEAKTQFWVIPWKLILIITVVLIIALIYTIIRMSRDKNSKKK